MAQFTQELVAQFGQDYSLMDRKPIYQAIVTLKPYLARDFKSFNSAKQINCVFIIKKMFIRTHTTRNGGKYEIYSYSFLDKNQMGLSLFIKKWSIEDIYDGYFGSKHQQEENVKIITWSAWNDYLVSDPNGEVRRKMFAKPEEAIKSLILFGKYSTWTEYELENK